MSTPRKSTHDFAASAERMKTCPNFTARFKAAGMASTIAQLQRQLNDRDERIKYMEARLYNLSMRKAKR